MDIKSSRKLHELLNRPDEAFGLAEAALYLAKQEYPSLEVPAYLRRIDALTAELEAQLPAAAEPTETIIALNRFLFSEQGFSGNIDAYYDPRNSFLNEVLDRKLGIPITLSILYLEIGRRLGLPLEGVSFPGHFLVMLPVEGGDIVLDPFSGGASLSEEELENQVEALLGESRAQRTSLAQLLVPAAKREILVRLLRNLKGIYTGAERYEKAVQVVDSILALAPFDAGELRDRGRLYERLECFRPALADYQRYAELQPEAEDLEHIRGRIIDLQAAVGHLH